MPEVLEEPRALPCLFLADDTARFHNALLVASPEEHHPLDLATDRLDRLNFAQTWRVLSVGHGRSRRERLPRQYPIRRGGLLPSYQAD